MDLKGKNLLLIGGVMPACEIVKEAHKMGVNVIVTDYLEDSPAKKIADKSFMVSATDVDAVVELCKQEEVDGIITGYVDSLLPYCVEIAKKANLPFWGNKENIDICIDKQLFKIACEKSGLPVVPWKLINENNYMDESNIDFPVVIKPVDNSGSRGIVKCYSAETYKSDCIEAFSYSKKKELLVEKMMNPTNEISAYYFIVDGKAILTGIGDRYVNIIDEKIAPVGKGMYLPSKRISIWEETIHPFVEKFFSDNNMKNGFAFLQGFEENGKIYVHEIGYRLNGGFSYKIIEHFSKYNQIQELIRYTLTGKVDSIVEKNSNPHYEGCGFICSLSLKKGTITQIEGVDSIRNMKGVIDFCQLHNIGEYMGANGTTAQVFAYILCGTDTKEELNSIIDSIKANVKVLDENGDSMLNDVIKSDDI